MQMSASVPNPSNPYTSPAGVRNKSPLESESNSLQGLTEQIRKTIFWARFVAIFGFGLGGITLIGGVSFIVILALRVGTDPSLGSVPGMYSVFVYFLGAMFYILPSAILFAFTNKLGQFLETPNMENLSIAMGAQTTFWRLIAIILIAATALCILLIAGGIILGVIVAAAR
jgi:hypothetical protein